MNPFKAVSEFVGLFVDEDLNGAGFALGNLVCWVVIYFVSWFVVGYLGPYLLMLVLPVYVVPRFWAGLFWVACNANEEKTDLRFIWLVLPFFLGIFIVLNGLPGGFFGFFFDFLESKFFVKTYSAFIDYWWQVFNSINYFADNKIPYKFYAFNFLWAQWAFILPSVLGIPVLFFNRYQEEKERIKEEKEEIIKGERKERLKKERALREAKEEEEAERLEQERQREKQAREKEKEARKKEIAHPNPWDSGFLG